jgi:hypothetical protein
VEAGSCASDRVSLAASGTGEVYVVVSFISGKVMFCVFGSRSNRIMSRYFGAIARSVSWNWTEKLGVVLLGLRVAHSSFLERSQAAVCVLSAVLQDGR